ESGNIASKALSDRRGLALAAGLVPLLILLLVIASALGAGWLASSLGWPLIITVVGLVLIWRNAPGDEQAIMRRLAEPLLGLTAPTRRSRIILRALAGILLLVVGLGVLLSGRPQGAVLRPLAGVALVIAAIVVLLGPWWLRIARDLMVERQARARAEERADM